MTEAPAKPPVDDATEEDEETKWTLFRTPGQAGILPAPGQRRFSDFFKRRALQLDPSMDAYEAKDQSDWGDRDVFSEESWRTWGGML